MTTVVILPGTVFGRLTVIGETRTRYGALTMLCQCECGKQTMANSHQLRAGNRKSCGCIRHGDVADLAELGLGEIPLYGKQARRRVVLVDEEDRDLVMQYRWYPQDRNAPGSPPLTYAKASTYRDGKKTTISMHALLTGFRLTDHKDGDGLNNRRSNLREATYTQNGGNSRKGRRGTSRFKGVSWSSRDSRWTAQITVNRHMRPLGRFTVEEDAAHAYDAAALEAWGEFARLNFPRDSAA